MSPIDGAGDGEHISETEMSSDLHDKIGRTPLPWLHLSAVYLIFLAQIVAQTVVNPFINQFVRETGITQGDERKTGYFSGIIQTGIFVSEAISVVPLGVASDKYGRRSILLSGALGLAPAIFCFGLSSHFWPLVVLRFIQGAFNGTYGVMKTVIGEVTDSTNVADGFAMLSLPLISGMSIGPIIGGVLANPAKRWPEVFGKIELFQQHPYFLPCLAASFFSFLVFLYARIVAKETLHSEPGQQKYKRSLEISTTPLLGHEDVSLDDSLVDQTITSPFNSPFEPISSSEHKAPSLRSLVKLPDVRTVFINQAFTAFCGMAVLTLTPLMWSTSIELGGLEWSSYQIGITMGAHGAVTAFIQVAFLGKAIRRFGPRKVHIVCFSSLILSFLSFPAGNFFARRAGGNDWKVWITVFVCLTTQSLKICTYSSLNVILTESAPSLSSLGTVNGMGHAIESIWRCLSPFIVSSLHSLSLQLQLAGGNAVYYIMVVIVACGVRFTLLLPCTRHSK